MQTHLGILTANRALWGLIKLGSGEGRLYLLSTTWKEIRNKVR